MATVFLPGQRTLGLEQWFVTIICNHDTRNQVLYQAIGPGDFQTSPTVP